MANRDYYSTKPLPAPSPEASNPYYAPYNAPSTSDFGPAPPYQSSQNLTHGHQPQHQQRHGQSQGPSPFDTVFDDHVYPMQPGQSATSSAQRLPSDNPYGRQSPSDDPAHTADAIPLQNRTRKDSDFNDHVYDDPGQGRTKKKPGKGKVRFGELGMFGANKKKIPFVVYTFTVIQIAVFIGEIIKNAQLTGSPIMIQPQFNPMIGPSTYVMINMGSRFVPCMRNVTNAIPDQWYDTLKITWPCPNSTTFDGSSPQNQCRLTDLCGFGGFPDGQVPNQWYRFIIPMFMHAGLIHIAFNLLLQLTMGREMEKSIGSIRFFLVYISAGIFGFILGGNYAALGIASTGASGSLFGVIALTLLDLLYSWKDRRNPVKDLLFIILDIVISFVLGLLPGLDNFSHIGGFLMGLALGVCLLHSPNALRRRIGEDESSYASVNATYLSSDGNQSFFRNPVAFFKGRKPLWWAWWLLRAGALVGVTVVFIVLLNNFYVNQVRCEWCKYLSCLKINNWCEIGNLEVAKQSSVPTTRANAVRAFAAVATPFFA